MEFRNVRILIFDIDGVLVYVGDSYRKAIVETVQWYFSEGIGLGLKKNLIQEKDIQAFKLAGNFNDDWELTYGITLCFLTKLISELRENQDMELELDLREIAKKIEENGGGLGGTEKTLERKFGENLKTAKKFCFYKLIKEVFQEFYLGRELFKKKYKKTTIFVDSNGFITDEKSLITPETLERIARNYYMGIATGRERFEVEFMLKAHGFAKFFDDELIVAREDSRIRKPDPYPLLECKERICRKYNLDKETPTVYIGDIPDDIIAAKNAKFYSIGCLSGISDSEGRDKLRKEFEKLKCDLIIDSAEELRKFL